MRQVDGLRAELAGFVADVFASVPRRDQRAKGDCYLRGLMLDGRRKSVAAMAGRLPDGDEQNLQQFVNQSPWDPVPVRRRIAERMMPLIGPDAWVIDDVSFPKDGKMSVGVSHQYCGALGKRTNCRVAVSVHAVTDAASVPLHWWLFLPKEGGRDTERRRVAGVPQEVGHREKWRLALDMLDEPAGWGLTPPLVVAGAGYGQNADFRAAPADRGLPFVVGVRADLAVQSCAARPTASDGSGNGRRPQPLLPAARGVRGRVRRTPRALAVHRGHLARGIPRADDLPLPGAAGTAGAYARSPTPRQRPDGRRGTASCPRCGRWRSGPTAKTNRPGSGCPTAEPCSASLAKRTPLKDVGICSSRRWFGARVPRPGQYTGARKSFATLQTLTSTRDSTWHSRRSKSEELRKRTGP